MQYSDSAKVFVRLIVLSLLLPASLNACSEDSTNEERQPLICDAIEIPLVTFAFTDAVTGDAYCGCRHGKHGIRAGAGGGAGAGAGG